MFIAKGYDVRCFVEGEKTPYAAPRGYAMLHDPEGKVWDSKSILVARFSKDGKEIEDDFAEDYFGDPPMGGSLDLPPRGLKDWRHLGICKEIQYSRRRPHGMPSKFEGDYFHIFDGSEDPLRSLLSVVFLQESKVELFKKGKMLRMELPEWADLNERGYLWP